MALLTEALENKAGLITFGVKVVPSTYFGPSKVYYFGTAALQTHSQATADFFSPGLESLDGIVEDGAPWFDAGTTEIVFKVRNGLVTEYGSAPAEIVADLNGNQAWEGAACTAYVFIENAYTWTPRILFVGIISSIVTTETVVEFRAVRSEVAIQVPVDDISANSMNYTEPNPDPEGLRPKNSQGAVAPLVFGRCHMQARSTAHDSASDPWGQRRGDTVAPMLGIKIPMVPVPTLADLHRHKNGIANFSEAQFLLVSLGSTWTGAGAHTVYLPRWWIDPSAAGGYVRGLSYLPGSSAAIGFPEQGGTNPMSTQWLYATGPEQYFKLIPLFQWNQQLGVATPLAKDISEDQATGIYLGPESLTSSIFDYTEEKGVGAHTTRTGRGSRHYVWGVQRIDPNFTAYGPGPFQGLAGEAFTGLCQAIAIQGDRLVDNDDTTDGFSFLTTSGVVDPLACIDGDPYTYTQIPVTEVLGLQLAPEGPKLGEPMHARICMITGGTTTALDIQFRYTPQHLLTPTTAGGGPFNRGEYNFTAVSATTFTHNPNAANHEPYPVFHWWSRNENPGLTVLAWNDPAGSGAAPNGSRRPRWEFWESDLLPIPANHAPDIRLSVQNGTAHIYAIWIEIIYRPKDIEQTDVQPPVWASDERPPEGGYHWGSYGGAYGGPGASAFREDGSPKWIGRSNLRSPAQQTKSPTFYATGFWGVDTVHNYTAVGGGNNDLIEDPVSIGLYMIDHYLNEKNGVAVLTPGVFGSFWDAKLALDALHANWRMTVIQTQRVTIMDFLDELGRHGAAFYRRTHSMSTGALTWRMFVDETTPSTSRKWRSYGTTISKNDVMETTVRATRSPLQSIRNRFVCRYGYHEPTRTYLDELVCDQNDTNMTGLDKNDYWQACINSVNRYGVEQEFVEELPWIWQRSIAEEIFKWRIDQMREVRVGLEITASHKLLDVEIGHFVPIDDDFEDIVGEYPGVHGTGNWSDIDWNVVGKTIRYDGGQALVDLVLVEAWQRPPPWIP